MDYISALQRFARVKEPLPVKQEEEQKVTSNGLILCHICLTEWIFALGVLSLFFILTASILNCVVHGFVLVMLMVFVC